MISTTRGEPFYNDKEHSVCIIGAMPLTKGNLFKYGDDSEIDRHVTRSIQEAFIDLLNNDFNCFLFSITSNNHITFERHCLKIMLDMLHPDCDVKLPDTTIHFIPVFTLAAHSIRKDLARKWNLSPAGDYSLPVHITLRIADLRYKERKDMMIQECGAMICHYPKSTKGYEDYFLYARTLGLKAYDVSWDGQNNFLKVIRRKIEIE